MKYLSFIINFFSSKKSTTQEFYISENLPYHSTREHYYAQKAKNVSFRQL